jgi:hypothetical protein
MLKWGGKSGFDAAAGIGTLGETTGGRLTIGAPSC